MDRLPSRNDNRTLSRAAAGGPISPDTASELAVKALTFVAADRILFDRLLNVTGLDVASIRRAAATPGFLPGVLDFILAHEPTLIAFAEGAGVDPASVVSARHALGQESRADGDFEDDA